MAYMDDFELGAPELVCRWRLAGRSLILENRHLRALRKRIVGGTPLSPQLVAWAKQHVEWTLAEGAAEHPDGVLMLVVDGHGRAAMTVGPYEPPATRKLAHLVGRASQAACEAERTGVAPEVLWVVEDGLLTCGVDPQLPLSGASSLVDDLARTLGVPLRRDASLLRRLQGREARVSEAFLVSDEHGVVVAEDRPGPEGQRSANGYARLVERAQKKARERGRSTR